MRFILVLIIIVAIFALIQSKRHDCEFGESGWFDCVISNTKDELSSATPDSSSEAPAAEEPATETPQ
jgi:hypothetical protein